MSENDYGQDSELLSNVKGNILSTHGLEIIVISLQIYTDNSLCALQKN